MYGGNCYNDSREGSVRQKKHIFNDLMKSWNNDDKEFCFKQLKYMPERIKTVSKWPPWLRQHNTVISYLQTSKTPSTSDLCMKLNNRIVRLRYCWNFGKCGV